MKNALKYLRLWQKKRDELPIDTDPESDWMQMHSLLDKEMPVAASGSDNTSGSSKGFKLTSLLLIGLSAAAMTYVITYVAETTSHKHKSESNKMVLNYGKSKLLTKSAGSLTLAAHQPDKSISTEKNGGSPRIQASDSTQNKVLKLPDPALSGEAPNGLHNKQTSPLLAAQSPSKGLSMSVKGNGQRGKNALSGSPFSARSGHKYQTNTFASQGTTKQHEYVTGHSSSGNYLSLAGSSKRTDEHNDVQKNKKTSVSDGSETVLSPNGNTQAQVPIRSSLSDYGTSHQPDSGLVSANSPDEKKISQSRNRDQTTQHQPQNQIKGIKNEGKNKSTTASPATSSRLDWGNINRR